MIKLNKMIDVLNENLSKEIHTAVRKAAKQMDQTTAKRRQPVKQSFPMQQTMTAGNSNVSIQTLNGRRTIDLSGLEGQNGAGFNSSAVLMEDCQPKIQVKTNVNGNNVKVDPEEVQQTDWMDIIAGKANLDELARLAEIKANKTDFED